MTDAQTIGRNLKAARIAAGFTQESAAEASGLSKQAISGQERGAYAPTEANLALLAQLYRTTAAALRYGGSDVSKTTGSEGRATYQTKPKLRPAPYARVYGYLEKMREAHMPEETIDEAERYLVDSNFGQLNKRDYRERSDDEVIGDIDMMWAALKIRFERDYGIRL